MTVLLLACSSTPAPEPASDPPREPARTAGRPCEETVAGSPALFTNPAGIKVDAPKACDDGTYIRVYGSGSRRIVMGREGKARGCDTAPLVGASSAECPEIFADAFARDVSERLKGRGIDTTGIGLGACGASSGDYDAWNYSISVADWAAADLAVTAVSEEMHRWGAGHHFGVTVRAIPCAVPLVTPAPLQTPTP